MSLFSRLPQQDAFARPCNSARRRETFRCAGRLNSRKTTSAAERPLQDESAA